jgi:hypothetical protein
MDWFNIETRKALLARCLEKAGSKARFTREIGGSPGLLRYWTKHGPPVKRVPQMLEYLDPPGSGE